MRRPPVMLLLPALPNVLGTPARARPAAGQDLVVIVNSAAHVAYLTRSQIIDLFMARLRQVSTGAPALPIDLSGGAARAVL